MHYFVVFASICVIDFRGLDVVRRVDPIQSIGVVSFFVRIILDLVVCCPLHGDIQSPSRRTPATRPPLAACGSAFHCGGPISLSSPREYPVEPMTCAMYSPAPLSSFLSCGLTAAKNCPEPSPMMRT